MPLTTAGLSAEVRLRLGSPPETDLPDAAITVATTAALRELNRHCPIMDQVTITLVPGQADYPVPAGTAGVFEAVSQGGLGLSLDPLFPVSLDDIIPTALGEATQLERRLRVKGLLQSVELMLLPGNIVRVMPTPSAATPAAISLGIARKVADVTPELEETFAMLVMAECLSFMGLYRNRRVRSIPTAVGILRLDDGKSLYENSIIMRREAIARLGGYATVIGVG